MEPSRERTRPEKRERRSQIDAHIIGRWCAWQSRSGIAKDLGLTEGQVRSRASSMGLPVRDRARIVPDYVEGRPYDPSLEATVIRRSAARLSRAADG